MKYYKIIFAFLGLMLIIVLFLFALNGRRYVSDQGHYVYDRWTNTFEDSKDI